MKMKIHKAVFLSTALTALVACDRSADGGGERFDAEYKSAMADYAAGRLDQAAKGFEKIVRTDPGNVSARFQLAVLEQDHRRDFLSALCSYRECILLSPDGDRAAMASERAAICEREVVRELLKKNGSGDAKAFSEEIERLKSSLAEAERKLAASEKKASESSLRIEALSRENARVKALLKSEGADESMRNAGEGELADAKSLLDGDDEPVDRILNSEDIASLRAEENAERSGTSSKFLPAQPEGAKAARDKARQNDRNRDPDESKRPETYVVQEGDTLYRIALRFYGRISAWAAIRDANKAVISTDGRVRAGQTIRLP
jgi:tetratricopeptide (TPR) repeat protein